MPENISTENAVIKADVGNLVVDDPILAKYAAEIRRLRKRAQEDIIEIGRYLDQAQKHASHGTWLTWIEAEFGWSDQTARRFIHVYEFSRDSKFNNLLNSDLPLSALYQLAAPKTPEEAREAIAERVEAGEQPTCAMVTEVIAQTKARTTKPADNAEIPDVDDEDPSITQRRAEHAVRFAEPSDAAPESETLSAHWRRETREARMSFLDDIGAAGILAAVSPEFSKQLQDRVAANTKRRKSIELATNAVHEMRGNGFRQ